MSPNCPEVFLLSAPRLTEVEQSVTLVQSLGTQVSSGALRASRGIMMEQFQTCTEHLRAAGD